MYLYLSTLYIETKCIVVFVCQKVSGGIKFFPLPKGSGALQCSPTYFTSRGRSNITLPFLGFFADPQAINSNLATKMRNMQHTVAASGSASKYSLLKQKI